MAMYEKADSSFSTIMLLSTVNGETLENGVNAQRLVVKELKVGQGLKLKKLSMEVQNAKDLRLNGVPAM